MRMHERVIFLNVLDGHWKDHLLSMDQLKEGIGLRGYGQRDPLVEYKKESFDTFQEMMNSIEEESLRYLYLLAARGRTGTRSGDGAQAAEAGDDAPQRRRS